MPGHVKKSTGPDPDPSEFLFISMEMKMKDSTKPYDPKKSCWVADAKEGYVEGEIQGTKGDLVTVYAAGETKNWKKEQVHQVNPPKYEKCEDMSNLTYLNDASVLYNLKSRYVNRLIYTYSGLFCIVINPYKRYPIYTNRTVKIYQGKRRNEVPPHLFAISDGAYMDMLQLGENQSMLITGESGAGKTENTKKVLSYFANVGASTGKKKEGEKAKPNLEDQIVQTNPVLEAFGNAKTTRNDNSSRFGKFIRIHFQPNGKLSGADIEVYLLEKARVISQQPLERSYHIFYEMMSDQLKELKPSCLLSDDIYDYHYVSQGKVTVPSIDDGEDMQFCDDAFDVLGFSKRDKEEVYKVTAAVMHFGEVKFKQRGREEQAEADGTEVGERVATLLGTDGADLYKAITKPKIKVGSEFVSKGMNVNQCNYSVGAMAKALFDRVFKWLVVKCNITLGTGLKRAHFIGVLDIAGFEIFEYNGFEQICINFCNEKLQQFFNHHMFVLEQEEYKKEGINWAFVDFGMDLQACIELFEKKMGLLSILEEESMFPKATDKSFAEKLNTNHLGKSPVFVKPKPPKPGQADSHFAIVHYAGTVSYNLSGWLEKNKDPLNDTLVDQLKKASNELIVTIFADHPGQSGPVEQSKGGGRGGKSGSFKTVSSGYRDQLNNLMKTLNATHPHFIRCIVPNETKSPGVVDAGLVMHQLTCNGVLEGIRICRKGFPNRMIYPDFRHRYKILASYEMEHTKDDKEAAKKCFVKAGLDEELYRLGNTKVFFRAGVLGTMEELRDDRLGKIVTWLQAWVRGFNGRIEFKRLQGQRVSLVVVQRNLRKFMTLKNWSWFNLWQKVKPLLNQPRIEDEIRKLKDRSDKAVEALDNEVKLKEALEVSNAALQEEKNTLMKEIDSNKGNMSQYLEAQAKLAAQKADLEGQLNDITERLHKEEESRTALFQEKKKYEQDVGGSKRDLEDMELTLQKIEQDKAGKDHQIHNLNEEMAHQEELISRMNREKKQLQEVSQKSADDLQGVEEKCKHYNNVKSKLEQTLEELQDSVEREKKLRTEVEKSKRKLEGDLKLTQETITDFERSQKEFETTIQRKDKEHTSMSAKVDEEQSQLSKIQRQIREQQSRVEELEAEVEHERQARSKAEKGKSRLARELEEVTDRLDEAGGATNAQLELNKKRENELSKLRREIEETNIQHESALNVTRKKHSDAAAEMSEQIEHLNRAKAKTEKEKDLLRHNADEAKAALDGVAREKAAAEKSIKQLHSQLAEANARLEESNRTLNDFDGAKKKLAAENADLLRQLEEADNQINQLAKIRSSLTVQLEDNKKTAEDESRERATLLGKYRNLEHDIDGLHEQVEGEGETKADLQRLLSKASAEAQMWRSKYESEGVARAEELEASRLKIAARLDEAEAQIEQLNVKNLNMERTRQKLSSDFENAQIAADRAQNQANAAEKKQRNFDRIIGEWKVKVDDLAADLDSSQKESRNYSTELFRFKAMYDETLQQLDSSRRENKGLTEEIKDLMDQISEGGRSLHEVEKTTKRLEIEKEELQAALEEAEAALEQEENKVLRSQLELSQVRQEIDRRIQEKEEEFDNTRKSYQQALENMQTTLEAEAKAKAEALRLKKKLESDITELDVALDHSNKGYADLQKGYRKLQAEFKDLQVKMEEEQRLASEYRDQFAAAERRANAVAGELEESRTLLEQSDRGRRQAESSLTDANEQVSNLTAQFNTVTVLKRKLEGEYQTLQADVNEMLNESRNSEDKSKKAMVDAARLADELRAEQDHSQTQEKTRKSLEVQLKELQTKLEDCEGYITKTGKRSIGKLEARMRELEGQLDDEARRHSDAQKNLRKCERRIKELTFQADEDKKNHERMQDLVDKLQQKIKTYKRQIEEAEEIAALNLAKYRKAQQELEEANAA
ncbi:hypothetical protein Pcinc_026511 [Petrolisthes cinctipes]|uniref:Myosin heavy chain n=1 Tax=Petrolisthes cinctipes TaxID=88211 RepID=A0AAE1F6R0_PETCI|nr:hypothetical protein Pcinc_026511 [Petrolisthes cinctipes]